MFVIVLSIDWHWDILRFNAMSHVRIFLVWSPIRELVRLLLPWSMVCYGMVEIQHQTSYYRLQQQHWNKHHSAPFWLLVLASIHFIAKSHESPTKICFGSCHHSVRIDIGICTAPARKEQQRQFPSPFRWPAYHQQLALWIFERYH